MIKWTDRERNILKQRCGQKGLPPGFKNIIYRQNRYLTDPIALVLYQLCEVVREIQNSEGTLKIVQSVDLSVLDTTFTIPVVIIVMLLFHSSFLLQCLLCNHTFKTNPNSVY